MTTRYVLRLYQDDAVGRTCEFLLNQGKKRRNGLVYVPTGGGKSLILGTAAINLANHPRGGPVIITQPTREILEQNLEKIRSYGFDADVFSASMNKRNIGSITLTTIGSIYRHPEWFEDFRFALVDEAHLTGSKDNSHIVQEGQDSQFYHRDHGIVSALKDQENVAKGKVKVMDDEGGEHVIPLPKVPMYKSFFESLPQLALCGFSASPYRLESNAMGSQLKVLTRTRPRIWHEFVSWIQYKELFDAGYLSKIDYYQIPGFKKSQVTLNSSGSDFDKEALQLHLWERLWESKDKKQIHFPDKLTEVVRRVLDAGRRNALVFVSSIREAEYLATQMGGDCAVLTGTTPTEDRAALIRDFRSGHIPVVANVNVLGLGFDFPQLECLIDAYPTMSLARYDQKLGRLTRPHEKKKSGWAIDLAGGYEQFGKLEHRMLYCQGQSRWDIFGRPGGKEEKQLTSVYLAGDGLKGCCPKCHSPKQIAFYEAKGKWLPISMAPPGMRANLVVEQKDKKKTCRMVERGDPDATHLFHFIACDRFKAMREAA